MTLSISNSTHSLCWQIKTRSLFLIIRNALIWLTTFLHQASVSVKQYFIDVLNTPTASKPVFLGSPQTLSQQGGSPAWHRQVGD